MSVSTSPAPYEVLSRLGAGGMAEVYLARPLEGGELVALKRVRPEMLERADVLAQFRREARISSVLKHPNIVSLRAFGEDADGPWLALEYVHGRALSDLLRVTSEQNRALPLAAAIAVCRDAAAALSWAHAWVDESQDIRGIVHRDVSPDNILISFDGRARLADFGIARWMEATVLTQTGMVKGKLQYLAPELYEGHEADALTDTFALGATLYTVLAGVRAFSGRNEAEIIRAVQSASPAPLTVLRPEIPAALASWIHGSLEKARERRPPLSALMRILEGSAPDGQTALSRCMQEAFPARAHPVKEDTAEVRRHTRVANRQASPGRGRRAYPSRVLRAAAAAALVVGAAGAGLWWSRSAPAVPAPLPSPVVTTLPAVNGSGTRREDAEAFKPPATLTAIVPEELGHAESEGPVPADGAAGGPRAAAFRGPVDGGAAQVQQAQGPEPTRRPGIAQLKNPGPSPTDRGAKPVRESPRAGTSRVTQKKGAPRPAARTAPTGPGTLWVRAWPWAEVFVDGVPKGRTPLEPFSLPAGSHTVLLVNQSLNESRTMKVRIVPGEESVLKVVLTPP